MKKLLLLFLLLGLVANAQTNTYLIYYPKNCEITMEETSTLYQDRNTLKMDCEQNEFQNFITDPFLEVSYKEKNILYIPTKIRGSIYSPRMK